ncbi:MAG: MFS transporter [Sciscionella sp.]
MATGVLQRLGPLQDRGFRFLLIGHATSLLGSQMAPVAIVFAVLRTGGGAGDVGKVLAAQAVALVVCLFVSGVVADRFSRRVVMVLADLLRCVGQLVLAVLLLTGRPEVWEFMLLLAATGAGQAFFGPAMTGLIPHTTAGSRLHQANALLGLASSGASIGGPALAGVIVATSNAGWAVLADGLSYLVSVLCVTLLPLAPTRRVGGESFLAQMRDGWREFRSRTWLWGIVSYFGLWHLLVFAPFMVLGAVIAADDLGGAGAWAAILTAQGIGAVVGGLVMLRVRPARPLRVAMCAMLPLLGPLLLLAVRAPTVVIAATALLSGIGFAVFDTLWDTTLQRVVPERALSRVSAYDWVGSVALLPVGYALIGPLTLTIGVTGTLWLSAGCLLASTIAVLAIPGVTRLRVQPVPEPIEVS